MRPNLLDLALLLGLPPLLQLPARQLLGRHGDERPRPNPPRHHLPEEAQVLLVLQVEHKTAVLVLVLGPDVPVVEAVQLALDVVHELGQLVVRQLVLEVALGLGRYTHVHTEGGWCQKIKKIPQFFGFSAQKFRKKGEKGVKKSITIADVLCVSSLGDPRLERVLQPLLGVLPDRLRVDFDFGRRRVVAALAPLHRRRLSPLSQGRRRRRIGRRG